MSMIDDRIRLKLSVLGASARYRLHYRYFPDRILHSNEVAASYRRGKRILDSKHDTAIICL